MNELLNSKKHQKVLKKANGNKKCVDGLFIIFLTFILAAIVAFLIPEKTFFENFSKVGLNYYSNIADTIYYEGIDNVLTNVEDVGKISVKITEKKVIISPMNKFYLTFDYSSSQRECFDNSNEYILYCRILLFCLICIPTMLSSIIILQILSYKNIITLKDYKTSIYGK